ncbi:hypothetical protein LCGC14_2292300, partial [marine sediment metagenome]
EVLGPDQRRCPARVTQGARLLVHVGQPGLPGFYEIRRDKTLLSSVSVNVSPREGDLRRVDDDVLREHLTNERTDLEIRSAGHGGPVLRVRGKPLWPWFVLAAMMAIGLELVVLCVWKQ